MTEVETKMETRAQQSKQSTSDRRRHKGTRQQQLMKLLTRRSGATITQIQTSFGWQPHTARAAISTLRKTGATVERRVTDKGSVYRIAAAQG